MRIIGIIPARYGSTRFPGKPLAELCGRPMIARVVDVARASGALHAVLVATDDERIAEAAASAGAEAVMTEGAFVSGTDRVAFVARSREADVVVNIQGDEPLLPPEALDRLVAPFRDALGTGERVDMATLAAPFDSWSEVRNPRTAKIVLDDAGDALYFSRAPIPLCYGGGDPPDPPPLSAYLRHIGVYAYRSEVLQQLAAAPPGRLEQIEGLEQLRALQMGIRIRVARICHGTIGVDTPEDLEGAERELRRIVAQRSSISVRG